MILGISLFLNKSYILSIGYIYKNGDILNEAKIIIL